VDWEGVRLRAWLMIGVSGSLVAETTLSAGLNGPGMQAVVGSDVAWDRPERGRGQPGRSSSRSQQTVDSFHGEGPGSLPADEIHE
jgi:hypothetical protein